VSRGIASSRLSTISYGEERPAHDNSTAATRRLNRRATMVVHATDLEESTR
jgi:outer membrane protein OmpA-like peptidoglycan-associated protein